MFISGVFQTTRGRRCFFFSIFSGLKNIFQKKKTLPRFKTTMGYLRTEYAQFDFSSCATYF